jgi:hypothetical protein
MGVLRNSRHAVAANMLMQEPAAAAQHAESIQYAEEEVVCCSTL